jgi:hypothetical protein
VAQCRRNNTHDGGGLRFNQEATIWRPEADPAAAGKHKKKVERAPLPLIQQPPHKPLVPSGATPFAVLAFPTACLPVDSAPLASLISSIFLPSCLA